MAMFLVPQPEHRAQSKCVPGMTSQGLVTYPEMGVLEHKPIKRHQIGCFFNISKLHKSIVLLLHSHTDMASHYDSASKGHQGK